MSRRNREKELAEECTKFLNNPAVLTRRLREMGVTCGECRFMEGYYCQNRNAPGNDNERYEHDTACILWEPEDD